MGSNFALARTCRSRCLLTRHRDLRRDDVLKAVGFQIVFRRREGFHVVSPGLAPWAQRRWVSACPQPSLGRWPGRRFKSCRLSNRHPGAGRNPASCLPRIVAMGSATMGPSPRFSHRLSQGRSKAGRKPGSRPPRRIAILAGSFTASFCRRRQRGGEALPGVARRTPPRVCSGEKSRRLPACPSERRPASRTNISPAHPSGIAFANRTPYAGLERVRTAV